MAPPKKFVPRQRKHKVRAREAQGTADDHGDANRTEILPEEVRARNAKKEQLRAELRAGQATQMSAKKAKRLDKYIETKLRKDESRELNEKLAARAIDPAAVFESSRDLGKGKRRRRAELMKQKSRPKGDDDDSDEEDEDEDEDEDMLKPQPQTNPHPHPVPIQKPKQAAKKAINTVVDLGKEERLKRAKQANQKGRSQGLAGNESGEDDLSEPEPKTEAPTTTATTATSTTSTTGSSLFGNQPIAAGAGLKRPLELGDDGRPVLKKRQKRGGVKSKFEVETVREEPAATANINDSDSEWNGFSDETPEAEEEVDTKEDEDGEDESGEESDSDSGSDAESDSDSDSSAPRISGFKVWAQQQRNDALGFHPTTSSTSATSAAHPTNNINFTARDVEFDPLPPELQPTTRLDRKAFHVDVSRTPEIETARMALPVVAEEQQIVEAIHEHDVVVISGGTGSGKTTQVPQFLYEAGYGSPGSDFPGMIGITQPRRVAAVSMAKRVAQELGPDHGRAVAYQIRFETTAGARTAIKFMTDGVLLREMSVDIALRQYSAIIIDEAHERTINTDVLLGVASRVNRIRADLNARYGGSSERGGATAWKQLKPLKVIIMSATLQVAELTRNARLFPTPPRAIHVEGRQYPVTVHFAQATRHDYVEEAFRKIARGHRKLPPGGFLVFLTGEDEIQRLAARLRLEVNGVHAAAGPKVHLSTSELPYEPEDIDFGGGLGDEAGGDAARLRGEEDDAQEDDYDADEDHDDAEFVPDEGETLGSGPQRVHVLPLFSKLPTKEQQRVFQDAPAGSRLVVLATNVAETSLTIPGIRYVFDCGRAKARTYNRHTGVQSFEVGWISKASASQRSGRAGRTGPGHCYRLYSSAVYEENFEEFAEPEILRMPIEGVVLQLKAMHVPKVDLFPFPSPPDRGSLARAERLLTYLSAVQASPADTSSGGTISDFGKLMSAFPLSPRFAKIVLIGHLRGCIHYAIALVAALSADEVFVRPSNAIPPASTPAAAAGGDDDDNDDGDGRPRRSAAPVRTQADVRQDELHRRTGELFRKVHRQFCSLDDKADALKLLQVVGEFSHEPTEAWCRGHFVHHKALREIQKMRRQITALLRDNVPMHKAAQLAYQEKLPRPTDAQISLLKQIAAAGFVDSVAIRADKSPNPPDYSPGSGLRKPNRAIEVAYRPLQPLGAGDAGAAGSEFVYIHPSSPLAHMTVAECPQYVVYAHLQRAAPRGAVGEDGEPKQAKVRMRSLTDVTGSQLAALLQGTPLLTYGKPIKETYLSPDGRERQVWVVPSARAEDASVGLGWPLPAVKVWQRKVPGRGWEVFRKK